MSRRIEEWTITTRLASWMLYKLKSKRNAGKPHWRQMDMKKLFGLANEEMNEVAEALCIFRLFPSDDNLRALQMECADVANFMAMLADRARQEPLL